MKTSGTVLLGVGVVAAMVLLPRSVHAQVSSDGGNGGPPDGSEGGPPDDGEGGGGASDTDSADLVYCPEDGSNAHYEEFLYGEGETMVRWAGSNTGCPNHVNWALNPNPAAENPLNESIPAYPMLFAGGGTTDLSKTANTVAIMRNGVSMFSAWAKDQVLEYEDTAFYLEADTFDPCGGHSTTEGIYHYHGTAGCVQEQAGGRVGEHSPLLGWSLDGFPFYGQLGPGGIEMKMCGEDGADSEVCLDGCSGYEAFIEEDEFAYRYYTSCGFDESFFPFTANCYRGCCPEGVTCNAKVEACGEDPDMGYTTSHVPEPSDPLDQQYDTDLISGDDTDVIGDKDLSVDCTLYLGSDSLAALASTSSTTLSTIPTNDGEASSSASATAAQAGSCSGLGTLGFADGAECCPSSCGACGGTGCGLNDPGSDEFRASEACCSSGVVELGRACSEYEPPCTGEDSTVGDESDEAEDTTTSDSESSIMMSVDDLTLTRTSGQSDATDDDGLCSDGLEDETGMICCNSECSKCGGEGCKNNLEGGGNVGRANCCTGAINEAGVHCGQNGDEAPCIIVSEG